MSELKKGMELKARTARSIADEEEMLELGADCPIEPTQVYIKSEADKVIAEKDAKILALDAEVFKQKHHAELFLAERNYAETQLRHHKYKRCLDKAEWCESKVYHIRRTPLCDMSEHEGWQHDDEFWQRWHKRWLELAEKFKEGK